MRGRQRSKRQSSGNEHGTGRPPALLEQRPFQALAGELPGNGIDGAASQRIAPVPGHSFANVRVHSDTEADQPARSVDAAAYTTAEDSFFRAERAAGTRAVQRHTQRPATVAEAGAAPLPLDEAIGPARRARMESLLGADFSGVTVGSARPGELAPGAVAAARGERIQ